MQRQRNELTLSFFGPTIGGLIVEFFLPRFPRFSAVEAYKIHDIGPLCRMFSTPTDPADLSAVRNLLATRPFRENAGPIPEISACWKLSTVYLVRFPGGFRCNWLRTEVPTLFWRYVMPIGFDCAQTFRRHIKPSFDAVH